jgi:uncharacterized protein YjbI with pentapeptide repeats
VARGRDEATPRIDPLVLRDLAPGEPADLRAGAHRDGERFEGLRLDEDLAGLVLDGCELTDVSGDEVRADGARLLESALDRLNVTTLRAKGSVWRDVRLTGSRIGAAEWFDAEWRGVELISCRIGYLNLAGARIQDVRLTDCVLDELDLRGAEARRVAIDGGRIGTLSVTEARLQHVDLTGTELGGVDRAEGLRGAVVDDGQLGLLAPLLAEALGIRVAHAR